MVLHIILVSEYDDTLNPEEMLTQSATQNKNG